MTAKYTKINSGIIILFALFLSLSIQSCDSEANTDNHAEEQNVPQIKEGDEAPSDARTLSSRRRAQLLTGPELLLQNHLNELEGKKVGIVGNHTSLIRGKTHLVDTLLSAGVNVTKVFAPEHGFRGTADAGEKVASGTDPETGLPIISLYGKNRKPTPDQIADLDVIIFDIQDIGSRHYTYIGTMSYVMEACAEQDKPVWILDRPNPNGWYVEGPVLEKGNESFIGMHEVPIVHGMTIGEYAQMVNGEGWLKNGVKTDLKIILCEGYTHSMSWDDTALPWIAPSPNIGTEYASYLYPAICWFEPTPVSVGRGTNEAFTILGAPWFDKSEDATARKNPLNFQGLTAEAYDFTPVSLPGKSKYPKFQDELCHGIAFKNRVDGKSLMMAGLLLMENMYQQYKQKIGKGEYFKKGFHRWPGNKTFQHQLEQGLSPEDIYTSWQEKKDAFMQKRAKYLLYPDFE